MNYEINKIEGDVSITEGGWIDNDFKETIEFEE